MKSHYIRKIDSQTSLDRKKFFTLLQFLIYAQTLNYKIDFLKSTRYRLVRFRVQVFTSVDIEKNLSNRKSFLIDV